MKEHAKQTILRDIRKQRRFPAPCKCRTITDTQVFFLALTFGQYCRCVGTPTYADDGVWPRPHTHEGHNIKCRAITDTQVFFLLFIPLLQACGHAHMRVKACGHAHIRGSSRAATPTRLLRGAVLPCYVIILLLGQLLLSIYPTKDKSKQQTSFSVHGSA